MIRSITGWLADLATTLICLTADITRARQQHAYQQQCWLDAMRAERSRKWPMTCKDATIGGAPR